MPLIGTLRQLADLIAALTDQQYTLRPVGVVSSSFGGHVRHNLDHVDALLAAIEYGVLDYDQRHRGTQVETSRHAALQTIGRLERQLLELPAGIEQQPLRMRTLVASSDPPVEVETSVGRELAFVLSHTIHHNALIGVMAKLLGVAVPEHFGYAPSTIAHLEKKACVR
jgi:uncharacterized damage-inducible protein DinB